MPCQFELDYDSGKGTLWFAKGAQIATTKVISGNTVGFDAGGVMVNAVFPNARGTMNLANLPFAPGDHEHVIQVMTHHNIKTGG